MRSKQPPRLAALLLNVFAVSEPLVGDLQEEYLAGRPRGWYWRQVFAAVFAKLPPPVAVHDLFAVQGMFMQFVMLGLVSVCSVFTVKLLGVFVFDDGVMGVLIGPAGVQALLRLAVSFGVAIPIGVAIARMHAHSRRTALLTISTVVPLWAFANLYLLDGHGNLDSALPHVIAILVFICGLLRGAIDVERRLCER